MKHILFLLTLISLANALSAQYVYTIKADSVKLTNCDSSELIIENHTQNVPGFLFNTGNGRTAFKKGAQKLNDSSYLIGADTLKLNTKAWVQGGNAFGATGVLGTKDNNHLDFYTNNKPRARLDSLGHFSLDVVGNQPAPNLFALTNSNGSFPWISFSGDSGHGILSMRPNNPAFGPVLQITTSYSSTIETFAYSDLAIKGFYGLDLYGGYGGGAAKYIRFIPGYTVAAFFTKLGNFILGDSLDNGNKFQVTGNIAVKGSIGIGTSSPTAQLHTSGSVRFAGLTNDTTKTRVIVSDANGNLYYRDASTLAINGILNSSLAVNGTISAQRLKLSQTGWPDYVFDSCYRLPNLKETERYIQQNGHLPGIPSAKEVENKGVDVGDHQAALLKKIEELTLYTIDQNKKLETQEKELNTLKQEMLELKRMINNKSLR